MRPESYPTHRATFSTDSPHEYAEHYCFMQVRHVRFSTFVAAFLIGLITGLASSPDAGFSDGDQSQRREMRVIDN